MLGYLLFQYQEELGFASDLQDEPSGEDMHQRDRGARFDADVDMNLKDGNYDRVQGMLKEALKRNRNDPVRIGQLYQLLKARNDTTELYQYHPRILGWLADRNDGDGITSVLGMLEQAEPGFKLDDPELAVRSARCLYQRGQYKPAIRLLQDFHKRFPDSDELAPAYLLVAQSLANGLNQWEKATAFLTFIQKRCESHPLHEQVPVFLAQAEKRELLKGPRASFLVQE
jgi:tetratricopeptide (TPR) repeat protein